MDNAINHQKFASIKTCQTNHRGRDFRTLIFCVPRISCVNVAADLVRWLSCVLVVLVFDASQMISKVVISVEITFGTKNISGDRVDA